MIEPLADNILLEPLGAEQMSASGLVRPETAKEKPETGLVIAVGSSVKGDIKKSTKAIYKKWLATEVKHEGKTYVLVAEKDVLGVIK